MSFDANSHGPIEVFIVTNDDGSINGFAEVSAVAQMLSPYTRISSSQLWNATPTCYKIQNNGKNFVHAYVVCKYLATIPETDAPSYKNLRQLVHDLTVGEPVDKNHNVVDLTPEIEELHKKVDSIQEYNQSILGNLGALLHVLRNDILGEINSLLSVNGGDADTTQIEIVNNNKVVV
ncbi:p24 [Spodoptera frugiperda granulovirus]|uniref:p24 n=1 Tax=Spodoptera frugiperda granulovirus TaxID=307454 RepID=A0A0C5AQ74_9BBAC|nr:p24 [Spodoptera frugiperda granulovirus]AJK91726.1 p24 [Spodoptera frugiperda granulovirus]